MIANSKIRSFINSQEFLAYLLALVLSTLFIGYAPSSIAMGIFISFAVRYAIIHKYRPKIDFRLVLPILLYLLFISTLFWTVNEKHTLSGLSQTIVLLLVPVAFIVIPKFTLKSFKIVLENFTRANVLLGLFFLTSAVVRYSKSYAMSDFTYHDLVSDLDLNAIYVSVVFVISLFYLLSKKGKTGIDISMIIFFSFFVLILSSKSVLFLLILGYIIYNISHKVSKKKLILGLVLGLIIAGFGTKKTIERILFEKETKLSEAWTKSEFGQEYLWTGTSIRMLQLRILKEQIEEEAIFWKGFGLFASRDNVEKRHSQFNTFPVYHVYNYHNQYAQIMSETGIFGLALLLGMLAVLFVGALNTKNFLFLMFSITIPFVFFTESLLWRQIGLFIFIILYCLFNRTIFEDQNLNNTSTIKK